MKLPNHTETFVPRTKITDYLLSFSHRDGRGKAAFFTRYGFSAADWRTLAEALHGHAANNEVLRVEDSPFGKRYVIEGIIETPDGRTPMIRSVWFIEMGEETARFVTAYPLARGEENART